MGDFRMTSGEGLPATPAERRRRSWRRWLTVCVLVGGVVAAGFLVKMERYTLATGYVTTEEYAEVRSPVTGIVSRILVHTGEVVEAGQVLVELNSAEEEATLSETRARVSKLKTEMERRQAEMAIDLERRGVDLAEQKRDHAAQLEVAELELQNMQSKLKLTRELVAKELKAASELEDVQLQEKLAEVRLATLKQKNFRAYEELLERDKAKYAREMDALAEELAALEDSVRRVEARLELRKIRAPIAGQVVRYEFVVGELLQPTYAIYEIFGGGQNVLKLRVDERYATRVRPGQHYRARLTSVGGALPLQRVYFYGTVEYLRNVIQAEGKSTYRMAYCTFDAGDYTLPPGTTAEARIYYDRTSFWSYLFNLDR